MDLVSGIVILVCTIITFSLGYSMGYHRGYIKGQLDDSERWLKRISERGLELKK